MVIVPSSELPDARSSPSWLQINVQAEMSSSSFTFSRFTVSQIIVPLPNVPDARKRPSLGFHDTEYTLPPRGGGKRYCRSSGSLVSLFQIMTLLSLLPDKIEWPSRLQDIDTTQ